MKYGKTSRAALREIDAFDVAIYGPTVADAVIARNLNPLKAVVANDVVERKIGFGTGTARKLGRKLGKSLRRARGVEESSATLRASLREDEDYINPQIQNLRKFDQSVQRDPMYRATGNIPVVGPSAQLSMERKRAGKAVSAANKAQLARMEKAQADKLEQIKASNRASAAMGGEFKPEVTSTAGIERMKKRVAGGPGVENQGKRYQRVMSRKRDIATRQANIQAAAARWNAKNLTPVARPTWGSKFGSFGKGAAALGAVAAIKGAQAVSNAAEEVTKAASGGYADMQRNIRMGMSAGGSYGNLLENFRTWATRKNRYGPSGRKHKTWKFDFNKPSHVRKALSLKSDSDIKKLMKSNANITKHTGLSTKEGIPIKYAYRSNNGKHLYAGKTIGMRQHTLSQHRKLGLPLPKGFENSSFEDINNLFKRRQQQGWYKRQYSKAPLHRKLMIGIGKLWKGVKKSFGFGESAIIEDAVLTESEQPKVATCVFMDGTVASPVECDCADCLAVTRRIRESRKLEEMAETSVPGTMLMAGTHGAAATAPTTKKLSKKMMLAANKKWRKPPVLGG